MGEHSLTRAYKVLLGDAPSDGPLYLKRKDIDHAFRLQALDIHLERIRNPMAANEDQLRARAQLLHRAYRLLVDVIGPLEATMVMLTEDDQRVRSRRPIPKEAARARRRASQPKEPQVLGRFLHSQGHITLQQLIDAVKWQRAQRNTVGEIALEVGYLKRPEVILVLQDQQPQERFCQAAIRLGLMTEFQTRDILSKQSDSQRRIGDYFVENGILTRQEVDQLAASPLRVRRAA